MRAVITGASGLVGGNLAVALLAAGHTVRATKRASTKVSHLDGYAIEWVSGDLDDPKALTEAFRGADVVFHCAAQVGVTRKITPLLFKANVEGTRNVVDAIKASGAKRLVHCSSVAAVALSEDGVTPSDETATWNFDQYGLDDGYSRTKREAEDLVEAAAHAGLDVVVVNPTFMFGPLDVRPSSGQLIVDIVKGKLPGLTPGMNNFVDVRDVARGMILAAEKGKHGERYILGGENMSYGDIATRISGLAGVKAPTWNVPRFLSMPVGWWGDMIEAFGGTPLLTSVTIAYGYTPRFIFTSEKAKRQLGYTQSPLDQAILDALAWFRAAGMLPARP